MSSFLVSGPAHRPGRLQTPFCLNTCFGKGLLLLQRRPVGTSRLFDALLGARANFVFARIWQRFHSRSSDCYSPGSPGPSSSVGSGRLRRGALQTDVSVVHVLGHAIYKGLKRLPFKPSSSFLSPLTSFSYLSIGSFYFSDRVQVFHTWPRTSFFTLLLSRAASRLRSLFLSAQPYLAGI